MPTKTSKLAEEMSKVVKRTKEIVGELKGTDTDIHHDTCSTLCDEFDLWEDDMFPMWVMYIVSGEMRDQGIL